MLKRLKDKQGFTLIEIVLVLAIAGLIMVIVFLAVSGAQKARRDTQRKNDVGRVVTAIEQYASNNNGNIPTTIGTMNSAAFTSYFSGTDPNGPVYAFQAAAPTAAGQIQYQTGVFCPGATGTPSTRSYAVTIYQEQATAGACRDNH